MSSFPEYLRQIARKFPSQLALAKELGMTPQRLSRALAGEGGYSFNTENCLRLAKVADRPAGEVLRAAGKAEIAEILEFLFPHAGRPTITGRQRQLLDDWDALDEDAQEAFQKLIHGRVVDRKRKPA